MPARPSRSASWTPWCGPPWPQIVQKQVAAGIAVVNDGEQGKPGYATYIKARVTGFGGESRVTTAWA